MLRRIVYVTSGDHRYAIEYRRLVHWSNGHRTLFQIINDHFWYSWSVKAVFNNGSVEIQRGAENLFFPRKKMSSTLKTIANNWEKEWNL